MSSLTVWATIIILFLAVIIFFDPIMSSETESYFPDYIDTTYIIYAFIFAIFLIGILALFSLG